MIGPLPRRSRLHPRSTVWRIWRHRFERDLAGEGLRLVAEVTLQESVAALVHAAEHGDRAQVRGAASRTLPFPKREAQGVRP